MVEIGPADKPFGERTATLVTVRFDPVDRRAALSPGSPNDVTAETTTIFEMQGADAR